MFSKHALRQTPCFTLALLIVASTLTPPLHGEGATLVTVPDDASTINGAIAIVSNGGTVMVRGGTYEEYVYLNKPVALIGLGKTRMLEPLTIMETRNVTLRSMSFEIYPFGTEPGITIFNAGNVLLENLCFKGTGILVVNSTSIMLRNCSFTENPGPAVRILGGGRVIIEKCVFNNTYTALSVQQGVDIVFRLNTVYAESLSIKLFKGCVNSTVCLNNIMQGEAEDNGLGNKWFNETLKLGNFWRTYSGSDKDGDGIIDEPKKISGSAGSLDKYPLAKMYEEYLKEQNQPASIQTILVVIVFTTMLLTMGLSLYRRRLRKIGGK
jgi:hypothetical protein